MNRLVGAIASICAFVSFSHAQENAGNHAQQTKPDTAQSQSTIGDGVRKAGREIKSAGRTVRRVVVTRCADGRHTVKGKSACASHGGVSSQN